MARTIRVDGMSCEGCESTVVDSLNELSNVEGASADHEAGTVSVEGEADDEELRAAVEGAGYEVAT
ncbi:heavy metal-associated domain-containing protein [Halalkalicoccus tibetensis]|uniref:Heavy-metal-associated domain-containing protein n=1 Tax=Halalkalicoccus tibetensis TaxID=175632 RepID=A0ABD5V6C8_9EURY